MFVLECYKQTARIQRITKRRSVLIYKPTRLIVAVVFRDALEGIVNMESARSVTQRKRGFGSVVANVQILKKIANTAVVAVNRVRQEFPV